MSFHDSDYREIITKAVCGRGRNRTKSTDYVIPSQKPTSILGCWVINHEYHAKKKSSDIVEVHGTYDINIWYSYHNNTKTDVVKDTINYCDEIELSSQDMHCLHDEDEIIVKVIQQPNCLQCDIKTEENQIAVQVEKEFVVNVIGETKVNVRVSPTKHKEHHDHEQKHDKDLFKGHRR